MQPMCFYGPRTSLADGKPHLVEQRLRHAAAPCYRGRYQPRRAHVRGQRREGDLNCCHLAGHASRPQDGYFSDFLLAIASSTLSCIPKTLVRPVIRKIFNIRSCVQTRSSDPSCARTRLSPPTRTPRPVESRNSTFSMFTTI